MEMLAVINEVGYGMRDFIDGPGLFFTVHLNESKAALLCFFGSAADTIIKDYGVWSIEHLNNKPCIIEVDNNNINFVRAVHFT